MLEGVKAPFLSSPTTYTSPLMWQLPQPVLSPAPRGVSDLPRRFRERLASLELIPSKSLVLVGLSGRGDSVALLHLLVGLSRDRSFRLHGAHLEPARTPEAVADTAFVRDLARGLHIPLTTHAVDLLPVPPLFQEIARRVGADLVATGETADDAAADLLLKLLHDTPVISEALRERSGNLVRPLLCFSHEECQNFLREHGYAVRPKTDALALNGDRQAVQLLLLPFLGRHFDREAVQNLGAAGREMAEEAAFLRGLAHAAKDVVGWQTDGVRGVAFVHQRWLSLPAPLRRILLTEAIEFIAPAAVRSRAALGNLEEHCRRVARESQTVAGLNIEHADGMLSLRMALPSPDELSASPLS